MKHFMKAEKNVADELWIADQPATYWKHLLVVQQYKQHNSVDQGKLDDTTQPLVHNNIKEEEFMYQKVNITRSLW
jgi:hypothetical protein